MKQNRDAQKETLFVLAGSLVLSLLMQAIFLLCGKWRLGVLYSNLITVFATTLNFYLMCLSLERAVARGEEEAQVKARMKASYTARMLLLAAVVGGCGYVAVTWGTFDLWALLIPLVFTRLTLLVRGRLLAKEEASHTRQEDAQAPTDEPADAPCDGKQAEDQKEQTPPAAYPPGKRPPLREMLTGGEEDE